MHEPPSTLPYHSPCHVVTRREAERTDETTFSHATDPLYIRKPTSLAEAAIHASTTIARPTVSTRIPAIYCIDMTQLYYYQISGCRKNRLQYTIGQQQQIHKPHSIFTTNTAHDSPVLMGHFTR
jgi:hypothetical protein